VTAPGSYAYYPGCSSKGTGRGYEESLYAVLGALGAGLDEIDDWNCCGATAFPAVDQAKSQALAARIFALAEKENPGDETVDLVAPCAGCFRALLKSRDALEQDADARRRTSGALEAIGLSYEGRVQVRHPLDVLVNDIGVERIAAAVERPLDGIRVACYYGCLLVRPYAPFDDQYNPTSMERLMGAVGAEPVDWPLKTRCCGGSCYCGGPLIGTMPEATLRLSYTILREARKRGADVVATACSLCQFNLEAFQDRMNREFGDSLEMTVAFLPQLLGLAFGQSERSLGIQRLLRWRLPEPPTTAAEGVAHAVA
jgi:heterodisulfide reductase subunit B